MGYDIRRVAVLGAGTMGAAIAAHCANAGFDVDLLDIPAEEPTPEEEKRGLTAGSPQVRNRIVREGFERMRRARPPALMGEGAARRIRLGNFADDWDRLADADWIVEAIVERLEPKRELLARVDPVRRPGTIVSTNTSGIPIAAIAAGRSAGFRQHFLGTHFFNPPRYLKLVEVIPTVDTDRAVLSFMQHVLAHALGKGVVVARDTPNFIANRLGSIMGMQAMRYALEHGYGIEEVDALTGPLIGRPKTATFRLSDQVGLDIMLGVAENLYDLVPDDGFREVLLPPEPLQHMREAGLLGNKTGSGFYRRTTRDGETVFDVLDLDSMEYRPATQPQLPVVVEVREKDLGERLRALMDLAEGDRHAAYLRATILPALAYAAARAPEIAGSLADIDHAMEWGYGHEAGPFRTWDLLGVRDTVQRMTADGLPVAPWVTAMLEAGYETFYRDDGDAEWVYNPQTGTHEPVPVSPDVIDLDRLRRAGKEVARNDSASLIALGDGVLCLEIHSRNSVLDAGVIAMGEQALQALESGEWTGLVVANAAPNFSLGANLHDVLALVQAGDFAGVAAAAERLQSLYDGFRTAPRPVVAAPHGMTLGGGAELCLHADRIVAGAELYMGLVETGVGLIPAGGGCKEMLRRAVAPAMAVKGAPPLPFVQSIFETIALAKVSGSALEARDLGFLSGEDTIVMNSDFVLAAAKRAVLDLAADYRPPAPGEVYAAGRNLLAALEVGVYQLLWGRFASEYDGVIARALACVLSGGELSSGQWVPASYISRLEREAFVDLVQNQKTVERMAHTLRTGKPLRN